MKKIMNLWLMAALTVGFSLSVASCKDDDDTPSESEQREAQLKEDERDQARTVLSQLIDPTTADQDDWAAQTYEPAIGEADEQNALNRVVMTNTLANAAQRFANIIGLATLDSTTATYTYSNPQLGTLTYQRSSDGLSLATVTVDVKAVPGLRQITYRTPDQSGKNGWFSKFDGRAYYRFGDVVCLQNADMKNEYWVCVRPSMGWEGKGDSHWVTLSPLTDKNLKQKKVGGKTFNVPTALGIDKENMENLGEMLTALLDYEGWINHYRENDNNDYAFHDLEMSDYEDYHQSYFWGIVQEAGNQLDVVRSWLGMGYHSTDDLLNLLKGDGLKLLYNGYSWSLFGNKCTLYQATLKSPAEGQPLTNLCAPEYTTVTKDMSQCEEFDAQRLEEKDWNSFFGDGKQRWCIRHATGKQLGGGKYDKKKSLSTVNPKVTDVYVYYRYAAERGNELFDLSRKPERTTLADRDAPKGVSTGVRGYFMKGDVVKDDKDNRWICVQGSRPNEGRNYSYFISFDKCVKTNGDTDFSQLPTLDVAMQISFGMVDHRYYYYPYEINTLTSYYPMLNMYRETGFHYGKYIVGRDIVRKVDQDPNDPNSGKISERYDWHFYWNMLYRDPQDGKAYILRLVNKNKGVVGLEDERDEYHFYTCYVKDLLTNPRRMSVDDMSNQQMVDQYANEDFASWDWVYYDYDRTHHDAVVKYLNKLQNSLDEQYRDLRRIWVAFITFRVMARAHRPSRRTTSSGSLTNLSNCASAAPVVPICTRSRSSWWP